MSGPPKEAAVVVGAEGVDLELGEEAAGGDTVANGLGDGDVAHDAGASVVKAAEATARSALLWPFNCYLQFVFKQKIDCSPAAVPY